MLVDMNHALVQMSSGLAQRCTPLGILAQMSDTCAAVSGFLKEFWGETKPLSDDADIFRDLGIDGDDAFKFIERFAAKFGIEISNYHWYFHHGEEGFNIGGIFFGPPYRRVGRIPITPKVLAEAIRTERWPLEYPAHRLPSVRWDIRFSQVFGLAMIALLVFVFWQRFVR